MRTFFSSIFHLKSQIVRKDETVLVMEHITIDRTKTQFSCRLTIAPRLLNDESLLDNQDLWPLLQVSKQSLKQIPELWCVSLTLFMAQDLLQEIRCAGLHRNDKNVEDNKKSIILLCNQIKLVSLH